MFTLITRRFVELIVFFLVQTVRSLSIFMAYTLCWNEVLILFIFIKLAIFPFISWFSFSIAKLPNSLFFLSSTYHKIPPLLLVTQFIPVLPLSIIMFSIGLTCLFSSVFMCSTSDLRSLLIFSSMANTSWMLLSSLSRFSLFLWYFFFYSVIINSILEKFISFSKVYKYPLPKKLVWLLFVVRGFPPSPLFFLKAYIIYSSFCWIGFFSFYLVFLVFCTVLLAFSYFRMAFLLWVNVVYSPSSTSLVYRSTAPWSY